MTTTTDLHPELQEAFESLPDPTGLTKVIMMSLRDEHGTRFGCAFARHDTGMVLAAAQNGGTQFGLGPVETRHFVSQLHAENYLKGLFRLYLGREDVDFLVQESEKPVRLERPGSPQRRM